MKNLSKNKNNKVAVRWDELKELNKLKEQDYPDMWDSYYSNDYYDMIESYRNEYMEELY